MGLLRLYLALCVVQYHGLDFAAPWATLFDGREAVQLFYMLSGFYISMILCEKYHGAAGVRVFYLKRVLRILPLYVLGFFGIVAAAAYTGEVRGYNLYGPVEDYLSWAGAHAAQGALVRGRPWPAAGVQGPRSLTG